MFAQKPLFPSSNASNLYLPSVGKRLRRRIRPPPTPSFPTLAAKAAHIAENVSALKAKYTDYTTWLKTSTQQNHEPVVTQELVKNSLRQMGIDSDQAEQLVSTCSWYVYQFQKDLKIDPEQKDQFAPIENKKYKNKPKKTTIDDATSTIVSCDKGILNKYKSKLFIVFFLLDDSFSSHGFPSIRNNHSTLPAIQVSDLSTSSRFRRVDFENEQTRAPISDLSPLNKKRTLPKLQPLSTYSSNHSIDLDSSVSQRQGPVAGQTRSILRKQTVSSCSSVISTEVNTRKTRSRILTPSSTIVDDIPLGTRSQRLFGGSACFAQIMNELEQQETEI
jgi:hypothetical protein